MGAVRDGAEVRVLRTREELLKDSSVDEHPVDTNVVLGRMRLDVEDRDELARCMGDLLERGDVRGKQLRGDNRVMDVTVTAITEHRLQRLDDE